MSMTGQSNGAGVFAPRRNELLTTPQGVLTQRAAAFFENLAKTSNVIIDIIDVTDVTVDSANASKTYALIRNLENQTGFVETGQIIALKKRIETLEAQITSFQSAAVAALASKITALENAQTLYPSSDFSAMLGRISALEAQTNFN